MSIPKKMTVKCSKCGNEIDVTVFESVNTDYAPDVSKQIISGDLFGAKCAKCGFVSNLEYDILYHDVNHGAMIWVLHKDSPEYADRVAELRNAENIIGYKTTRIVNNINELRQKVACLENGRDDRIVELCKVFMAYNLLAKQSDFDLNNVFYTNFGNQERVFFYDKNGQELSCELTEDAYSLLRDMYYNSEHVSEFQGYYALVDYDWAENILQSLLEQESEKNAAKSNEKSASINESSVAVEKIICPQCKKTLPEDSAFCHYCGTPIVQRSYANVVPKVTAPQNEQIYTHPTINTYSTTNEQPESSASAKKSSKKLMIAILIICVVAVVVILGAVVAIPEYKYSQACVALDDGLYSKAIETFEELDGYKDSDDKIDEAKYRQACEDLKDGLYTKAIETFDDLGNYKDCESKINEAKYEYILENKNNGNTTTYEYLCELKRIDYKNSSDIYDNLYEWKITVLAVNTSPDDESTTKKTISKYDTVYFHLQLTGGTPNESVRLKVVDMPPTGISGEYVFSEVGEDGDVFLYNWWYNEPQYGTAGTLQCKFYDEDDNLIGVASVILSN